MSVASKKIILAISGASGSIYAQRAITSLTSLGHQVFLSISPTSKSIWQDELGQSYKDFLAGLSPQQQALIHNESVSNVGGGACSGSFRHDGMLILPCSVKTLGAIANGLADNFITRSADVCLKERKSLVLCVRETPLSLIHIENMAAVTRAGGIILPASPGFYHGNQSIEGLVDFVIGKCFDMLNIEHQLFRRWQSESAND